MALALVAGPSMARGRGEPGSRDFAHPKPIPKQERDKYRSLSLAAVSSWDSLTDRRSASRVAESCSMLVDEVSRLPAT